MIDIDLLWMLLNKDSITARFKANNDVDSQTVVKRKVGIDVKEGKTNQLA